MFCQASLCRIVFAVALSVCVPSFAGSTFSIKEKDVVVFFGGTNMLRQQQAGHLETSLTAAFANQQPKFRDLSWEADTVFRLGTVVERWRPDGFGGRSDQIRRVGTTVAIGQFGQLECIQGVSVERFIKGYAALLDEWKKLGVRVVLISPLKFERPASKLVPDLTSKNKQLEALVAATERLAKEHGAVFVDLFHWDHERLTSNGIHVLKDKQQVLATEVVRQLGVPAQDPKQLLSLRNAVREKYRLWYDYWRPANWKLLYGDDSKRQFTRGGKDYIPFREEWARLVPLIAKAEERVWLVAAGGKDPGHARPEPEVLHGDKNADIEKELKAFEVLDGFEVNLFASQKQGLTSPIAMRWDPNGRMYVAVTTTYPHVYPGDVPNDKIILLEDVDGNGVADKSTVFADGLNIPTGLELGDGGVYVGQNSELLFLKDRDGDGKADERRIVLSGFGNGDSHQTINSFIWSPGGELYFGQGDGIESRVETPWGSSDLFQAGFYRLRPRRLHLSPLLDDFMGPGNPWGVAFDTWGQVFCVDGAGGVTYLSPGQVPTSHRRRIRRIGDPGGYCGVAYLEARHLPDSLQGEFITGDFKSNRIKRFAVVPDGAGYKLKWKEPLLRSRHRNFRPVDVRVGPDGAIYIVDWYNPITCHQDDAYRDPTRDKAHGRIWRVSTRRTLARPPKLEDATIQQQVESLRSADYWTRYQAKRAMTQRPPAEVAAAINSWVRKLDPKDSNYERHLFEALSAYETMEVVEPRLLNRLLHAADHRARAYAARVVGRWQDRLPSPLSLLADRVADEHPQVRMEAVMACAAIPKPESIVVAARVLEKPVDSWIDYAFRQTIHQLKPSWIPAIRKGGLAFAEPRQLALVLNEGGAKELLNELKRLVRAGRLDASSNAAAVETILSVGDAKDLVEFGLSAKLERKGYDSNAHAATLDRVLSIAAARKLRPEKKPIELLNQWISRGTPEVSERALQLVATWELDECREQVLRAASDGTNSVRAAAFVAMLALKVPDSPSTLNQVAERDKVLVVRSAATRALVQVDLSGAAEHAAKLLIHRGFDTRDEQLKLLAAFLERQSGASVLGKALARNAIDPPRARSILRALYATGRSDPEIIQALTTAIGKSVKPPQYDAEYVAKVVKQAMTSGDALRGAKLFKANACNACHRISGSGGSVGPDLSALGTTLAPQRIAEELIWPSRQVKEGYSVIQVITDDGKIHQGFERKTKESESSKQVAIQDLASGKLTLLSQDQIDEKKTLGSPMPDGLTTLLSEQQLLDLIRYLSELGKLR